MLEKIGLDDLSAEEYKQVMLKSIITYDDLVKKFSRA